MALFTGKEVKLHKTSTIAPVKIIGPTIVALICSLDANAET